MMWKFVALCDVAEEGVLAFRDKHLKDVQPQPQIFTDAAQMYAESKPDAVTIVTPHTMHLEHASQALEAGLHVLLEKPMVTNSDDAYQLAEIAEKSGKVFAVGYNTTCTPEWVYVRELIRNEELGKLQLATGWLSQNWRKNTAGKWRQNPALSGGGEMYDSGAHLFNSLVWSVDQPVAEVHAFVDNMDTPVDIMAASISAL
jgi:predicted dehydrogenase